MTREEALRWLIDFKECSWDGMPEEALDVAIEALKQKPINKSALMHEIYMEGVNIGGEYQGCWVRFKNIEKIIDKYTTKSEVRG